MWHAACLPAFDQAPAPDLHTATKVGPGYNTAVTYGSKHIDEHQSTGTVR